MKVLVTGANGHIGSHVVSQLLEQGHEVVAFVRKGSDLRGLEGLTPEFANGDIKDKEAVAAAAEGCDAIIHMAAVYKTIAKTAEEIVEPALRGAESVFYAAKQHGIKRIVYTSSVASIGFSYDPNEIRTGDDWNDEAQNPYYLAKTQSEKSAQKLALENDIHLVVICPAIVLGPNDFRITPSNQIIMDWLNGVGQSYKGGLSVVDVRDVAAAHVAALTRGESGKRYVVGGENILVKELANRLKLLTSIRTLYLPTGRKTTLVFARIIETLCKLLHVPPPFTYDLVYEVVGRYAYYDTKATVHDLGVSLRGVDATLPDCVQWLLRQNRIRARVAQKIEQFMGKSKTETKPHPVS